MQAVAKICARILMALGVFLAGWIAGNWNKKKAVTTAVKKAIGDVQATQEKALKAIRDEYDEKLRKKDEIIQNLKEIINRLLRILQEKDISGKSVSQSTLGMKLTQTLHKQLKDLNAIK